MPCFPQQNYRKVFHSCHPDGVMQTGGYPFIDKAVTAYVATLTEDDILVKSDEFTTRWNTHMDLNPKYAVALFPDINPVFTTCVIEQFIYDLIAKADTFAPLGQKQRRTRVEWLEKALREMS